MSNIGSRAFAIRPSVASNPGNARASATDRERIASIAAAGSASSTNVEPSGYTFSDGPASSTMRPRSRRRKSRQIASRSIDST